MALVSLLVGTPQRGTRVQRNIKGGRTATIFLDATLKEGSSSPSEVTKHPVENGADIGDHVILRPETLTIDGVISETPFSVQGQVAGVATTVASSVGQGLGGALGGAVGSLVATKTLAGILKPPGAVKLTDQDGKSVSRDSADNGRIRDALNEFSLIRSEKNPVTIITGLRQYKNFILTNFEITRDQSTGGSVKVNLSFEQFTIANSQKVKVPVPASKQGLKKQDQGRKNAKDIPDQQQGSILFDLIGGK